MGTTQQIHHKKIGKRVRIGSLILAPFVLIGVAAIIFQLSSIKNGEYTLFDFNLGKLWSWAISSNKTDEISTEKLSVPLRSNLQNVESQSAQSRSTAQEIFATQPRGVKSVQSLPDFNEPLSVVGLQTLEVEHINPSNWYASLRSSKFFDPMEKEFLISPDIKIKRSKLAIGASFAPSVTYRTLRYSALSDVARIYERTAYTYGQSKEYRKNNDKAIMNFYSGVDVYFNVSEKWTLQTGFYYASYGEKLQVVKLDNDQTGMPATRSDGSAFIDEKAIFDSPEMVEYNTDQKIPFSDYYGMMEVPLLVSYKALNLTNQLKLEAQAGISYAYMDHADMLLYDYETNKYYWINSSAFRLLNRHFINVIGGVSISQYISQEIELFANPQFKFALTPTFTKEYEIKQHQWATGLRLGMKFHL